MIDDLRHSIRLLRRSPALTVACVCTLAVAIGASTAVFSVIDKVLVRPLPIDEPDRVVVMWSRERLNAGSIGEFSYPAFQSWRRETRAFETLAAMGSVNWSLVLREGDPATVPIAAVSAAFFPLMGTPAAHGRTLLPMDDERGAERVAVMSYGSWVRRFGADPTVVGRPLRFNDAVYTIVGIMPEGFEYPRGAELWVPLVPQIAPAGTKADVDLLAETGVGFLFVIGRINAGVTISAARDEVSGVLARGAGTLFRPGMEAVLIPLDEHIFGTTRAALIALAVCVGLVLLIACGNVGVLLLARAAARIHETATRVAIGATGWHILRQSLADALLVSILASAVGLAFSYWTIDVLVAMAPPDVPRLDAVRFDTRTFVFGGVVCLITILLVGSAPGLQTSRWNLAGVLAQESSRIVPSHRLRWTFVVGQVALALVLLVCGGLVARSFVNLLRVNIGFEPRSVLTLDVAVPDVPAARYNSFYTDLLARVRAMPGVDTAGAVFLRPLEHAGIGSDVTVLIEGQRTDLAARDSERNPVVNSESVTPGYFQAIGIRVLRGRAFTESDIERAPRVAVVSAGLAQRLWPGEDPIGRRILPGDTPADKNGGQEWSTVVGVVEDVRYRGLTDLRFDLYVPYLQRPDALVKHLLVRTTGDPLSLVDSIRAEARRLEPTALIERISTMDHIVGQAMAPWRFSASTLGLLSILALTLASLGVCAIVSQSVVERTREIGVRIAVGALPRGIAWLVLREGVRMTGTGIIIGLAAGVGVARVVGSLLYEVRPVDPLTLVGVASLFVIVSAGATLLPVWRATRVDPVLALRQQ
jgi:putative ABC transport system permease protein